MDVFGRLAYSRSEDGDGGNGCVAPPNNNRHERKEERQEKNRVFVVEVVEAGMVLCISCATIR